MADDADIANDYINTQVSRALAKLRQANDAKPGSGKIFLMRDVS
jgi:hypothetical protein